MSLTKIKQSMLHLVHYPAEGAPLDFRTDTSQTKMTTTPEGYLRGDAVVSRVGVFPYQNADGTMRYELRHPDDVLDPTSLATLKQVPVTLGHPPTLVNADNAKRYQVGQTGDHVRTEGGLIAVGFTITDAKAVDAVKRGEAKQLSLGYSLVTLPEEGEYEGQRYTHRQTNIRYNHLALVDRARAGNVATINLDGTFTFVYNDKEATMANDTPTPKLVEVNLDGLTYSASPEVAKQLVKLEATNADGASKLDGMKKELDEMKRKYDALKAKYDEEAKKSRK
jgi:hypothetical protein